MGKFTDLGWSKTALKTQPGISIVTGANLRMNSKRDNSSGSPDIDPKLPALKDRDDDLLNHQILNAI